MSRAKTTTKHDLRITKTYLALYKADVILLTGPFELIKVWAEKAILPYKYAKYKDDFDEVPHPQLEGRTWDMGGGGSLVWLKKFKKEIFVHELTHAALNLFDAKSTPVNRDTEEPFAYVMEYLVKNLYP